MNYKVLIADDSNDDRFFLKRALARFSRFQIVGEVYNGHEAISYLSGMGPYSVREQHPLPDVIMLDLKMPRVSGLEVLEWLQTQNFPRLTVIMLSDSDLSEDIGASLALGAKGFWTKTADVKRQDLTLCEIETLLDDSWKRWSGKTPPPDPIQIPLPPKPKNQTQRRY